MLPPVLEVEVVEVAGASYSSLEAPAALQWMVGLRALAAM